MVVLLFWHRKCETIWEKAPYECRLRPERLFLSVPLIVGFTLLPQLPPRYLFIYLFLIHSVIPFIVVIVMLKASKDPYTGVNMLLLLLFHIELCEGVMDVFLCRRGGRWLQGSAKVQVRSLPLSLSLAARLSPSLLVFHKVLRTLSRFLQRCWKDIPGACAHV